MTQIKDIRARQILDSRGYPTVETTVVVEDGVASRSAVPSGVSTGKYEAVELRDSSSKRYGGMGVSDAIKNVNDIIAPKIIGMDVTEQQKIDRAMIELDGTPNKSKLGANAILSVSQAVVKAAAQSAHLAPALYIRQFMQGNLSKKLPVPMFNMIEGGKHGGETINIQEFLLIPASSKTYTESFEIGTAIHHSLKKMIHERSQSVLFADEGGFSPNLGSNHEALSLIKESIDQAGYSFSLDAFLGVDAAATSFHDGKVYRLKDRAVSYNDDDLVEYYKGLFEEFSLIYIEDPFAEEDVEGWKKMYQALGDRTMIVGDDLTCTNPYRLQMALDGKMINAVIIKPNQIGTITEAIAVVEISRYSGLKVIVSHRAGETMDPFIADFAVGVGADYVKFGAPARERVVKYNRLLEIEENINNS